MAKHMVTINLEGLPPTLDDIRTRYGLRPEDVDSAFGVVRVDPDAHDYVILLEEEAARRIAPSADEAVDVPFANPPIETFGPPKK
jgi:hypothetical protein